MKKLILILTLLFPIAVLAAGPGFTSRTYSGITNNQYLGTGIAAMPTFCANGPDTIHVLMGADAACHRDAACHGSNRWTSCKARMPERDLHHQPHFRKLATPF